MPRGRLSDRVRLTAAVVVLFDSTIGDVRAMTASLPREGGVGLARRSADLPGAVPDEFVEDEGVDLWYPFIPFPRMEAGFGW